MLFRRPGFINLILSAAPLYRLRRPLRRLLAGGSALVALLVVGLLASGCAELVEDAPRPMSDGLVAEHVVGEVNILRRQQGVRPLARTTELDHVAQLYAWEMARNGRFEHVGAGGDRLEDRLRRANVNDWTVAGENLAYARIDRADGTPDGAGPADPAAEAVRGWQLSESHRKNVYQPEYDRCGAAVARNRQTGEVFIVQIYLGGR